MICIECGYSNIDCLYSKYKSDYIKLSVCPECNKIADKYIEYDSVILFLDILLLKRRAYKHLAYNLTEMEMEIGSSTNFHINDNTNFKFFHTYRKLMKLIFMILSFEVYLTWANEEKLLIHSQLINLIFNQSVVYQYLFFIIKSSLENLILNLSLQLILRLGYKWGQGPQKINGNIRDKELFGYKTSVLLVTTMVSGSIRLFPILMFIWPYDNISITKPLINLIAFINIVEALRVVTSLGYVELILSSAFSIVIRNIVSKSLLVLIVRLFLDFNFTEVYYNEMYQLYSQIQTYIHWIQ
ncbi:protein arv [Candida albicans]